VSFEESGNRWHILMNVCAAKTLRETAAPKEMNMSDYTDKNMARHNSCSGKGTSATRHHTRSDLDTQEAKMAEGLTENRAKGGYSEAGIGILPISILS
jgi:hypothetical protein